MEYTETERAFMEMILKIGAQILSVQDNCIEFKCGYFDGNNLYELRNKLGLDDFDIF